MSSDVEEARPSNVNDPEATELEPQKKVHFDENVDVGESSSGTRNGSQVSYRRQSLIGKSGFVTQLLEEKLDDDSHRAGEEPGRKPIRKQTLSERKDSVKAVDADLTYYMKQATRKSKGSVIFNKSSSQTKLPTLPNADETLPSSGCKSSDLLEHKEIGPNQEISWVGTYIVGKDYWDTEKEEEIEKPNEVDFSVNPQPKSWYEMTVAKSSSSPKDSTFSISKLRSVNKIEVLKEKMDEEYKQKRKQRMIAAEHARKETKKNDEWSEEFKEYFKEMSKAGEFSHGGTHMAMVDADKWLEKAAILDHNQLTLVHTGFCFLATGGSRKRGLSFTEFTQFLHMISFTTGLPLRDLVRRMIACQRKPGQEKPS